MPPRNSANIIPKRNPPLLYFAKISVALLRNGRAGARGVPDKFYWRQMRGIVVKWPVGGEGMSTFRRCRYGQQYTIFGIVLAMP